MKRLWGQVPPQTEEQEPLGINKEFRLAEVVAERTYEQLAARGWCLWRCKTLKGDVVVIVRDELVQDIPKGYPAYTSQELFDLLDLDETMIRMIHEAKKLSDVSIIGGG